MFNIDPQSRRPVYEQIIAEAEEYILTGILSGGDQMPSVRNLSISLSANPNTVQKAYSELDNRGLIRSVPGKGCFVSDNALEIVRSCKRDRADELKKLIAELKLAETPKDEIIRLIDSIYGGAEK